MANILKIKNVEGMWVELPYAKGSDGKDGVGVPTGGTTGQYLTKKSNADYDFEWKDNSIDTCEKVTNKVTTINENSTDTEYPSAKCVYDIVGNIETILGGI